MIGMASLLPGWTADYDGQRWFFTYGPTGQSQFQFPRPGDEFPDLLPSCGFGFGAGDTVLPEVELISERSFESERQVWRGPDDGGGCTGDVMVDEEGGVRGCGNLVRKDSGDGAGPVCFENFAAVKSRGRHGLGGDCKEGARTFGECGFCEGDGALMPTNIGIADTSGESSNERVSTSLAIKGERSQVDSCSRREVGIAPTISIMSEPVLAVVETRPTGPVRCEQQLATMARPSPPELPRPDGRTMKAANSPPWAIPVDCIPELYSESTALCEEEINPPPVELPCNEGGRDGRSVVPNTASQNIYELPAQERPGTSLEKDDRAARLESRYVARKYTFTSQAGVTEAPRTRSYSHDRSGLPSQEHRHEDKVQSGAVSQERPARMSAMPPLHDLGEPQQTTAQTTCPESPAQLGGARQDRLPGPVNFVIPIRHMSGGQPHSEPCNVASIFQGPSSGGRRANQRRRTRTCDRSEGGVMGLARGRGWAGSNWHWQISAGGGAEMELGLGKIRVWVALLPGVMVGAI